MRFLFTTLQSVESEFYGRVGAHLERAGHEVFHLTVSRRSTLRLRAAGARADCLMDLLRRQPAAIDVEAERRRVETDYDLPSVRDVYRTDKACAGRPEAWCVERTVRSFLAVERHFDAVAPHVLVPEVGSETVRTAAHAVALRRGVRSLFLFFTIFPEPLRLYVDAPHAPIVAPEELKEPTPQERRRLAEFSAAFTARAEPLYEPRQVAIGGERFTTGARYAWWRLGVDRDNEYLRPARWARQAVAGRLRASASRVLYSWLHPTRPFVYFPLHVTDDFKIARVIPHWADQASLVEQLADALPPGYDLVLKEHPRSIGRNRLGLLLRLRRGRNVRLVAPGTSSHELIERSAAVAVISSTVGLEALLYAKPVMTLGEPFYSGYGVTLDLSSLAELRRSVPALLRFEPDQEAIDRLMVAAMRRCRPGAPGLVDPSEANAAELAATLAEVAEGLTAEPVA